MTFIAFSNKELRFLFLFQPGFRLRKTHFKISIEMEEDVVVDEKSLLPERGDFGAYGKGLYQATANVYLVLNEKKEILAILKR